MRGGKFHEDFGDGIGLNVYGDAKLKSDALLLIAKLHALGNSSCYFVTGNQLFSIVLGGGEQLGSIRRVRALHIDWFERDYKTEERPYTLREIIAVEDFLLGRKDSGLVTYFGSYCMWDKHKWYSRDFLSSFAENIVDVRVGK